MNYAKGICAPYWYFNDKRRGRDGAQSRQRGEKRAPWHIRIIVPVVLSLSRHIKQQQQQQSLVKEVIKQEKQRRKLSKSLADKEKRQAGTPHAGEGHRCDVKHLMLESITLSDRFSQ
ncbi:unnamed protein product [Ceratitis capitata]|uniref:(Mediterranean fruit fly) hypothetical protein n=1 Tax=Ceratitis capitata TaxID=7213 RepID=A0A811UKE8_CERCA|nr:unnamed protein product [Ceratitis capitata]